MTCFSLGRGSWALVSTTHLDIKIQVYELVASRSPALTPTAIPGTLAAIRT
jgi:hypothetical protein